MDRPGNKAQFSQGYRIRILKFVVPWPVVKHNSAYRALKTHLEWKRNQAGGPASSAVTSAAGVDNWGAVPLNVFLEWYQAYEEPKAEHEGEFGS